MKAWRHYLFNYLLLFTILNKCSIYSLKFERAQEGNRNSGGIVLDVLKNFHGNVCSEVLGKIVACQHGIY